MNTTETLKNLSDDELTELHAATTDDAEVLAVLAEFERRERKARRNEIDKARWAAVYASWQEFAHAQYLAAEDVCRGNLVRREYVAEVTTGFQLWDGSEKWARERATDELREFWDANTRLSVSEFRAQQRAAKRAEREAMGR